MLTVTKTYLPPFEEFCDEIRELWDSRMVTNMGPKHEAFREALEGFLGLRSVSLFANGHLALEAVLRAFKLPAGGEVITTPFTFVSTVNAIIRCGLVPVFADVLPSDGTMDPESARALISPRTVAILPVHVYGNVCDVEAFDALAEESSLPVIYDAAHAFGAEYRGVSALGFGHASIVSFHATKVFSTIEGGAVVLGQNVSASEVGQKFFDLFSGEKLLVREGRDVLSGKERLDSIEQRLDDEKNFGIRGYEECVMPGGNAKMNEFQAAMGICNLRHFPEVLERRKVLYDNYRERLRGVEFLEPRAGVKPNYSYMPVLSGRRDQLYETLKAKGIFARKYFYPLASDFAFCKGFPGAGNTPVASSLASRVLCLPLYPELGVEEQDKIIFCISENN